MDATVPTAEDHCRILILVKMLGHRSTTTFNHLMKSLSRVEATDVSENPKRIILAKFVTSYNPELTKFGDLQAHRKIFGFIGVAQTSTSAAHLSESNPRASVESTVSTDSLHSDKAHAALVRKASSTDGADSIDSVKEQYLHQKEELNGSLVDSRCVLLGFNDAEDSGIEQRELINYTTQEDFESEVRELIRSIYFVLESKRLDLSFEKMDQPPCPVVPEEEKTRVGTENRSSKIYKKKCVGRMRKQVGDYSLLTGLPSLATDAYTAAIEYLKNANDLLWLAAANEGLACAAMAIKYNETEDRLRKQTVIHRVSTMTPDELRDHQEKTQHTLGVIKGHHRYRSDDDQRAMATATAAAAAAQLIEQDSHLRKQQVKKPWAILSMDRSPSGKLDHKEIIEKFILALENYVRFSFIAYVEYECMIRASSVYRYERDYLETDRFLRDQVNKYLDDSFTLFDNITKAQICVVYSHIYKEMGFRRKTAFYSRLAVLFRLHANDAEARTDSDYKLVYPVLYRTLPGYGIVETSKEIKKGPVAIQIKAMHEVYMSALRANLTDAAIRHLCYLLQMFYDDLDTGASLKMLDELHRLVSTSPKVHSLAQHIPLDQSGIILSPLQMTRFPTLSDFKIVPLSSELAPRVISPNVNAQVFIYSPFENMAQSNETYWVKNCGCAISVKMLNPLPTNLEIKNLTLLTEGCTFEAVPVRVTLSPYFEGAEPTEIKLTGIPREPGTLTITGYSCEVLGVKNVCPVKEILPKSKNEDQKKPKKDKFTVDVLQELPLLVLESSLPKAPTIDDSIDPVAETTIFAGQIFEHSVTIENTSKTIAIKSVKLTIRQPTVYGSQLIEITDLGPGVDISEAMSIRRIDGLRPGEKREIKFNIFGIDPASITDESAAGQPKEKVLIKAATTSSLDNLDQAIADNYEADTPRNSMVSFTDDLSLNGAPTSTGGNPDLIPYSGRLLTADLMFDYIADIEGPENVEYERTIKLPLAICIIPALTVSNYEVLASGSPWDRYVVIAVTNSTELDAELTYSFDQKKIGVQAGGGEPPMVPVLVPCCPDVSARTLREACQHDSQVRQKQEIDILRRKLEPHIAKHLQISWTIPQLNFHGVVPIGSILAEVDFLKKLVVPTVSVDVIVNGQPTANGKDITVKFGQLVEMELVVFSVLKDKKSIKGEISLSCFQDLGNHLPHLDRSENMIICGPVKLPIIIDPISTESQLPNGDIKKKTLFDMARKDCRVKFSFSFLCEGKYKVRPVLHKPYLINEPNLAEDEVFVPTIGFDVDNKNA